MPGSDLSIVIKVTSKPNSYYESPGVAAMYTEFHYGGAYFNVPNFPKTCVEKSLELARPKLRKRALDLGCGPGRSTFELSRHFKAVDGVDLSSSFIDIAKHLASTGQLSYSVCAEGDIWLRRRFMLESIGLHANDSRLRFYCADACHLSNDFSGYSFIFAGNLLDRLYDPRSFLRDMAARIEPDGVLVLASPYVWSAEFTPTAMWLSYTMDSDEKIYSFQSICQLLRTDFDLVCPPLDVPFVLRETDRKYQHTISEMTIWRRRSK